MTRLLSKANTELYNNIPQDIIQFNNWICYNELKQPFQAEGRLASSTDPSSWNSFNDCVSLIKTSERLLGVAFVNTNTPITFLDIDHTDNQDVLVQQMEIYRRFVTYAERSPSGTGVRLIIKNKLPNGINSFKNNQGIVHVMSNHTYCTITGDVLKNLPINECNEELDWLYNNFYTSKNNIAQFNSNVVSITATDEDLIAKICSAVNGNQFKEFYYDGYPEGSDRSSVDLAFMNYVGFYLGPTGVQQAIRIIKSSKLAEMRKSGPSVNRKKFDRVDYLNRTYINVINNPIVTLPLIKIDNLDTFQSKSSIEPKTPIMNGMTPEFFKSLGILGEVAQYVYDDSPRQIAEAAFLAADCFFGGIGGKAFNISGTGLNQYNLLLADTGYGKGAVENCIDRLVHYLIKFAINKGQVIVADQLKSHIGPTFASGQGLIAQLAISNCFSSTLDEFGLLLAKISDLKASGSDKAYYSNLLQLYNKSGYMQTFKGVKHSKKDNDIPEIKSPAVTLALLSTASSYYDVVKSSDFANGLIPRIFTMEYTGDRPALNLNAHTVIPSDNLLQKILDYLIQCISVSSANQIINIKISDDIRLSLDKYVGDKIREAKANNQKAVADLWSRAEMKAMKKAGLFASCINPWSPEVNYDLMRMAFNLIENDIIRTANHITEGSIIGDDLERKACGIVANFLARYFNSNFKDLPNQKHLAAELHSNKIISWSYLQAAVSLITVAKHMKSTPSAIFIKIMDNLLKGGYINKITVSGSDGSYYKINNNISNSY